MSKSNSLVEAENLLARELGIGQTSEMELPDDLPPGLSDSKRRPDTPEQDRGD